MKRCSICKSESIKILNPGKAVMNYQYLECGHRGSFLITEDWSPKGLGKRINGN